MTTPFPVESRKAIRANWLGRYLAVEQRFDDEIRDVLVDAAIDTEKRIVNMVGDKSIGAKVRRTQLSQVRTSMRSTMKGLFGDKVTKLIKHFRGDAADAAVDAALYDELPLLGRFFKNKTERDAYQASLHATANRNIEATVTRVLGFSSMPLSKRVYNSQALATGQVDKVINRALSRGDSAKDLARAVRSLIDPNVPGGVSYAAMRLGRTEINNAFHAQSIKDAQDKPWVHEMRWHLSKVHAEDPGDRCELYAIQALFPIDRVPNKPHPQCRCYVTPELDDYDNFEQKLVGGQYDSYLDSILDAAM